MAKKCYVGVDGVAHKVKKGYVGVDGVARKIKRAYIGIGGVARPCWSGGELAYYGTITALSQARSYLAATSNGSYALFAGGDNGQKSNVVDAYNASLTRNTATSLSTAVSNWAGASVGNYATFACGMTAGNGKKHIFYAYDNSLTKSEAYGSMARYNLAGTTIGDYALFGGGFATKVSNVVESYSSSLALVRRTELGTSREKLAATTVGNHALFGGGSISGGSASNLLDSYDSSLTHTTLGASSQKLTVSRYDLAATTVGNHALFAGGTNGSTCYTTVDAYDTSLTRTAPAVLSMARDSLGATTIGNYALFGGGFTGVSSPRYSDAVDIYDKSLTRTTLNLSKARLGVAATTIGNYALFGGGGSGNYHNVVDAFTVA